MRFAAVGERLLINAEFQKERSVQSTTRTLNLCNYPNKYDAAWGKAERIISSEQAASISASWENRALIAQDTGLGGGIGFHGWIKEWDSAGPRHLSWGCVVMHIYDIRRLYEQIPEGAMVVIF